MTTSPIEACYQKLMNYITSQCQTFNLEDTEIRRILVESFTSSSEQFLKACEKGDLKTCQKLVTDKMPFIEGFGLACKHGHLEVAQWIREFYSHKLLPNMYVECMYEACLNGHTSVAKWLLGDSNMLTVLYPEIFNEVCFEGHLEIAQMIHQHYPVKLNEIVQAFETACGQGNIDIVEWLSVWVDGTVRKNGYLSAIYKGHLELVKRMWESLTITDMKIALQYLFKKRDTVMAEWLVKNHPHNYPDGKWVYTLFVDSCDRGYLEDVKAIRKVLSESDAFPCVIEDAFCDSVIKEQFEVVRWLLTFGISSETIVKVCDMHNNTTTDWLKGLITFSKDTKEKFVITLLEPESPAPETSPSPSQECNPDKHQTSSNPSLPVSRSD